MTYLAKEPCHDVAEHDGLVRLMVIRRCGDTGEVPKIGLPFVHPTSKEFSNRVQ